MSIIETTHFHRLSKIKDLYYADNTVFSEDSIGFSSMRFESKAFIGSHDILTLKCVQTYAGKSSNFLAGRSVKIFSEDTIELGLDALKPDSEPVYIYAWDSLCLCAKTIKVGNVRILIDPKVKAIVCDHLIFINTYDRSYLKTSAWFREHLVSEPKTILAVSQKS